ncbi:MAG TPA: helix-turn-helix transcriptional regulator [Acetobacteraceae bacterium]|nr:helix-turn-helix transcriptional regulator [Acetobacteraceae bacterium]
MSRQEYEDLIDSRNHAAALRGVAAGSMPTLSDTEMDAFLAAPTPLAFWRRRCSLTQAALARSVGISQAYLAQIETGRRIGDVGLYARLARRLAVRIEDLVAEELDGNDEAAGGGPSGQDLMSVSCPER